MNNQDDWKTGVCVKYIGCCMSDSLEKIAWAVVNRYGELYPDYEVGLLSLLINDPDGRKRCIEGLMEYLEKEKMDSLG